MLLTIAFSWLCMTSVVLVMYVLLVVTPIAPSLRKIVAMLLGALAGLGVSGVAVHWLSGAHEITSPLMMLSCLILVLYATMVGVFCGARAARAVGNKRYRIATFPPHRAPL